MENARHAATAIDPTTDRLLVQLANSFFAEANEALVYVDNFYAEIDALMGN